jgi:hypothetical protein
MASKIKGPSSTARAAKGPATSTRTGAKGAGEPFRPVFQRLRAILAASSQGLVVKTDGPGGYYVDTPKLLKGKPLFFGAVRFGKGYVSYHLFPIYMFPELLDGISPALKRRMQGKSCFNFKSIDEEVLAELDGLTRRSREELKQRGIL